MDRLIDKECGIKSFFIIELGRFGSSGEEGSGAEHGRCVLRFAGFLCGYNRREGTNFDWVRNLLSSVFPVVSRGVTALPIVFPLLNVGAIFALFDLGL